MENGQGRAAEKRADQKKRSEPAEALVRPESEDRRNRAEAGQEQSAEAREILEVAGGDAAFAPKFHADVFS